MMHHESKNSKCHSCHLVASRRLVSASEHRNAVRTILLYATTCLAWTHCRRPPNDYGGTFEICISGLPTETAYIAL